MSAAGEVLRGDCFQLWRDDAGAMLRLPDAERHEFTDALFAWFADGETRPLSSSMLDWFLAELTRKQTVAAARHVELKARRAKAGRAGMKKRWGDRRITNNNNVTNENENENNNENVNENENETRTPQAATVSPPDEIDVAIVDAAQLLGDGLPSRDKWRRFMLAHGIPAFRKIVAEVAGKAGIANKGAYLNTRLAAYGTNRNGDGVMIERGRTNQPIGVIHHEEGYENPFEHEITSHVARRMGGGNTNQPEGVIHHEDGYENPL